MRTMLVLIFTVGVGIALFSLPATACTTYPPDLVADCEGYTITATGAVESPWGGIAALAYHLELAPSTGPLVVIDGLTAALPLGAFNETISGTWTEDLSGSYTVTGSVVMWNTVDEYAWEGTRKPFEPVSFDCPPPGTGTPGYWKNHIEEWPGGVTIGGVTYTPEQAIGWLNTPVKGDKTITMFAALVCAKLNVLIGNDDSCIAGTITAADAWMAANGPVGSGVKAGGKTSPWREGEPLYWLLDDYNNGLLPCAQHRAGKLAAPPAEEATWGDLKSQF